MRKVRKVISVLIASALLLALLPTGIISVSAATVSSGRCGDNLYWILDGTELTIMGTGDMWDCGYEETPPWYPYVETAVIGEGVTSIGGSAFYYCSQLKSVTIPDGVTSIGDYAFSYCSGLTSVTIPDSVTSVGRYAFYGCYGLTSVTIPDSVTRIDNDVFHGCTGLTSVTIGNGVTYVDYDTFRGCYNLESVTLGSSVTSIAYRAFGDCWSLTGITLPESVVSIDECAFLDSSLEDVIIPKSVAYIGYGAFAGCELETLTVDPQNPVYHSAGNCIIETDEKCLAVGCKNSVIPADGSVTMIGVSAFNSCYGLSSITIPDSVTEIGYCAFSGCSGISVRIGSGVTAIGGEALGDCASITVDPDNPVLHSDGNCVINTRQKKLIAGCRASIIPSDGSVTSIASDAFYGITGLNYIVIPKTVINIESEYAFYNGYGYATLYVYKNSYAHLWAQSNGVPFELITDQSGRCGDNLFWSAEGFTLNIVGAGDMYDYDYWSNESPFPKYVSEVNISDGVTSIGGLAFYRCTGLTSVAIPDGVTSIGECAFDGCRALTSVVIPDSVTSIGYSAFEDCTGLTSVTIPDGVRSIGDWAFYGCTGLMSVTIPDSVTSIDWYAFSGCTGLMSVTIGNGVTSIGEYAFDGCRALTSVTIGNGVTSIGECAFDGCRALTSVVIPDSVTSIGWYAFRRCASLTSVTLPDSVTSICDGAFLNTGYYNDKSNWENGVLYIGNWLIGAKKDISGDYTTKNGTVGIAGSAFSGCGNITGVTIGSSVTSIVYSAFSGCTSLADVTLPDSVKRIDRDAFYDTGYYNDESNWENDVLYIGNWLIKAKDGISGSYDINEGTVGVAGEAFAWCDELTSVTIPDSVTSIGGLAFYRCTGLTSVTIGNGVTSIGDEAFYRCTGLTSVTIPGSVTSIGERAFYGCTGLTSVTIGNGVTSIGSRAFHYYDYDWEDHPLDVTLHVYEDSYAHRYAIKEGFDYELITPVFTKGDADGDGKISVGDALAALRIAARIVEATPEMIAICDVDGSGKVEVSDALAILRVAARIVDSL